MPRKQPQSRHAKHRGEEAAAPAMPQALRDPGHAHVRPNRACLRGFQRRGSGEHDITGHKRRDGRLYGQRFGGGGKLRRRDFLGGDSGQQSDQGVAASLLKNRLACAPQ